MTHLTARLIASLITLTTVIPLVVDTEPTSPPTTRSGTDAVIAVSPEPAIGMNGETDDFLVRLEDALTGFREAGLQLPELVINFSDDEADCGGSKGRFRDSTSPWEIFICSISPAVYEHELAHAWERANLTNDQRADFMEMRGYDVWSGADVRWNERGVEGVAFVIQQGLTDMPLPPVLSDESRSRLQAYEFLTGTPAPRLTNWMILRDIPCSDRPTPLSLLVPDKSDLTC